MRWGIYDDYTIRRIVPREKDAVLIRALEPGYIERGIPYPQDYIDRYKAVLDLYVDDIYRENELPSDYGRRFNESMALELISFIESNSFSEVNIHCSAGISRSSALMICVSRIIGAKVIEDNIEECDRYIPNKLILSVFDKSFSGVNIKNENENEQHIHSNEDEWKERAEKCDLVKNDDGTYSIIFV